MSARQTNAVDPVKQSVKTAIWRPLGGHHGRMSFARLQRRMHERHDLAVGNQIRGGELDCLDQSGIGAVERLACTFDLGDKLGFGPARPPRNVAVGEPRRGPFAALELVGEPLDLGSVESGADLAGVAQQRPVSVADQRGAEPLSRTVSRSPTAKSRAPGGPCT
jgi:hypothetical protein